jgi:2-polyprenyl-6-methoxyphenol hydroxylase-like FAD-dependent oxidoreductase
MENSVSGKNVLIAGAGPVGLAMAIELARYGVPVRIVDKAAERTDKSKALVLWSRTLEMFDRMGCTASFVDAGMKVTGVSIVTGRRQIGHLRLDGVATPYPFALMVPQSETERLLEEQLNTRAVRVERGVELVKFTASEDGVVSTLRHPDGREETVESSWLMGCDGAHSTVRHGLGMEFTGDTLPSDWILGDVHLSGVPNPGEVSVAWHAEGVLILFPIRGTRYRVIADGSALEGDPTLEDIQAVLDQRGPGGIQASDAIWLSAFHINERKVANYRSGCVFLAGDAAHVHSPAGGQGMNTGIQDACNLAWKLALVDSGAGDAETLLGSYSPERSAVGEEVLKNAGRLTAVAIMRGELKQTIRNHVASLVFGLSAVRNAAADAMTELSIGYPHSPLNGGGAHPHGGPAEGERAPIREQEQPVGAGVTPLFALFAEAGGDGGAASLAAHYSQLLEPEVRHPFEDGGIWLVRPDGYVALTARAGDWAGVAAFLDRIAVSRQ